MGKFTDAEGEKYGLYEIENPAFDYDAATKTFSTDELTIAINRGHNYYPYVYTQSLSSARLLLHP
ncbi:MAG: hypothetical protein SOU87_06110 [Prevotella sp.]|nr:hypothetical protein [Prevotella sp.]